MSEKQCEWAGIGTNKREICLFFFCLASLFTNFIMKLIFNFQRMRLHNSQWFYVKEPPSLSAIGWCCDLFVCYGISVFGTISIATDYFIERVLWELPFAKFSDLQFVLFFCVLCLLCSVRKKWILSFVMEMFGFMMKKVGIYWNWHIHTQKPRDKPIRRQEYFWKKSVAKYKMHQTDSHIHLTDISRNVIYKKNRF